MNVLQRDIGKFSRDPERSWTLPKSYYIDPEIYEREKDLIFARAWNFACHKSQVAEPGAYATCMVTDQNIVVMRGHDGQLRAFYNVCSHRAHELVKGCGKANIITCPYHAWTYHSDGRLRTAIGQKRVDGFEANEFALRAVKVEEYCDFIFVNLDANA